MHPPGADVVVVRYGDASVKSGQVQGAMERRLVDNVAALLSDRGVPGDVERTWSRVFVRTNQESVAAAAEAAADAFGVVSTSPARSVPPELPAITEAVRETAAALYDGGTVAVRPRRAEKSLPFDSEDVGRSAGAAAVEAAGGADVDLDDPDHAFHVEVRESEAFVFVEKREGPGGLPLGTQAPTVALVSGGIDSPVAAYEVMKRGSPVVPVYLDLGAYGGADHRARAMASVGTLARYAPNYDLTTWVVPAGDAVERLDDEMGRGRMLSYRRFMYRVGAEVAERAGAHGVVTGEAMGQKSSQTATNIGVVSAAVDLPVHRPLLASDKDDITELARAIGTFEDATIPAGCHRLVPEEVETNANREKLLAEEPDGLLGMAEDAVDRAERVDPLPEETAVAGSQ